MGAIKQIVKKNKAPDRARRSDTPLSSPLGSTSAGRWLAMAMIILTGLLIYSNNYTNGWLFDDYEAIVDNPRIQEPFSLQFLLHPADTGTGLVGRPVAALTFALNYALNGFNVRGYHLVNNLIHILAALTLFQLVRVTLQLPRFASYFGNCANWYALVVALLWAAHPLQTESVTYIVCRTESLMGLLYLTTLYCAVRGFLSQNPRGWYTTSVLSCGLGMGTKEVMVSAPLLVLLYDYLFISDSFRAAFGKRKGFYGALAATWLIIVFYQLGQPHGTGVRFDDPGLTVLDYFRTQMTVIVHYLRLAFWPHPLVLDSQDWPIVQEWTSVLMLPAMLLVPMAALTAWGVFRKIWWSFSGILFFAALAPTSSVIPLLGEIVAERRMYLPLAAVIVFVVFGTNALWRRFIDRAALKHHIVRQLPVAVAAIIVISMGYVSWQRNLDYRDAVTIWADTVNKRPANYRAQANLGKALAKEGRLSEAVERLRLAVRLFPSAKSPELGLGEIYSALATALSQLGNFKDAVSMHRKSVELQPGNALVHYRFGNTYLRVNDLDNAAAAFRRAIMLAPEYYPAHGNLAMILMQKGDYTAAEVHLQTLLKLIPNDPSPYTILAELRIQQGRFEEAIKLYRQALELSPGEPAIQEQLQKALALQAERGPTQHVIETQQ